MSDLPARPDLDQLRHQAKDLLRAAKNGDSVASARIEAVSDRLILTSAQLAVAREHGFSSWPRLVHQVQDSGLMGIERALVLTDTPALSVLLHADPAAATTEINGLAPLLVLLRRTTGSAADVRGCARLLLDAGADPNSHAVESGGRDQLTALFDAVERADLELVRLLVERGAKDDDAFYHACEHRLTAPYGGYRTTVPKTAIIRGRSERYSRPALRHSTRHQPVMKRSTRCCPSMGAPRDA